MKEILWLMKKTMNSALRKKMNLLLYFGLPLIGIFASILFYGGSGEEALRIGIVNQDGGEQIARDAVQFVGSLNQVRVGNVSESELNDSIASGKLDCALIIGKGFSASVRAGRPGQLQIVSVKGAQVTAYVKEMLYGYVDNVVAIGQASQGNASEFDTMYEGYRGAGFKLAVETVQDTSESRVVTNQSIGFLIAFMLFSAVNLSHIILKEKENRTYFRLLSTPITARTYVLSNVAVNAVVMVAQILLTLILMDKVFHIHPGIPFWQMFAILFIFALVAIGLSLAIVAFAKNSSGFGALQNLIITPTCLLSGCYFPMEIMPDTVRKISAFLPQHWLLDTFNSLQEGHSFASLYLNALILLAFAAAFALLAIYKFGRNNDTRTFI